VGPVFKTPTKPTTRQVGLGLVKKVSKQLKVPFVAIGGIDGSNVDKVIASGARCVAVVRALFDAKRPDLAARMLKHKILKG